MKNGGIFLTTLVLGLGLAACGGGEDNVPDADLTPIYDSEPPPIDAAVCSLTTCGDDCVDTDTDEAHCGDCDTACTQTGSSCIAADCVCPPNFLPATVTPSGLDQIVEQAGITIRIAALAGDGQLDALGVSYGAETTTDEPYTLDGSTLPAPPFAIALFNVDISTMMPEKAFAAISGTIEYSDICAEGASGTITNAVFQAADFDALEIDPEGCTFEVASIDFTIGDECPIKALAP
jgi:hypothetical protein